MIYFLSLNILFFSCDYDLKTDELALLCASYITYNSIVYSFDNLQVEVSPILKHTLFELHFPILPNFVLVFNSVKLCVLFWFSLWFYLRIDCSCVLLHAALCTLFDKCYINKVT